MKRKIKLENYLGSAVGVLDSPVGELTIIAANPGIQAILWDVDTAQLKIEEKRQKQKGDAHLWVKMAEVQLSEYFVGGRRKFELPLVLEATDFFRRSWDILQEIPYGRTLTYGAQAEKLGNKNKARAVGMANRANPISIVIPCHRVIGASGDLTGFAGGLDKKKFLLDLESRVLKRQLTKCS